VSPNTARPRNKRPDEFLALRATTPEVHRGKLRPVDPVGVVRWQLAHQHLDDIRALDAKMKAVRAQIAALVDGTGTRLTELYGIGPVIAGRILAEVDTIDRFPSKDHFASHNGTAPIAEITPASVPDRRAQSAPAAGVKAGTATHRATALTPARTTTQSRRGNSRT
jgi:transposase